MSSFSVLGVESCISAKRVLSYIECFLGYYLDGSSSHEQKPAHACSVIRITIIDANQKLIQ